MTILTPPNPTSRATAPHPVAAEPAEPRIDNIVNGRIVTADRHTNDAGWNLPRTTDHHLETALKSLGAHRPRPLGDMTSALSAIGRDATWITDSHLMLVSQRSGSPIKYLRYSLDRFNDWLANIDDYVSTLGGVDASGHLVRGGLTHRGGISTSMVLAGDELTLAPWTLSHAVLAGSAIVAKPSSIEPLSAFLFCDALIRRGVQGVNLLALDSTDPTDRLRVRELITNTDQSVVFGEDQTIARVYGDLAFMASHKPIPYWSGRSGAVVYPDCDVDLVARSIIAGATEDRGNRCISTKKVFAPRSMAGELEARLAAHADDLVRGAPTDPATDIGVNEAGARLRAEAASASSDVIYDRDLIIARTDDHSQLISEEAPYPTIGLRYYADDDDPIAIANDSVRAAPSGRSLVMSVFADDSAEFERAAANLRAAKVLHNAPTSEWDPSRTHQSMHLCVELMRPVEVDSVARRDEPTS